MQAAEIFLRMDGIYVNSSCRTVRRLWISGPFYAKTTADVSAAELGRLTLRALAASRSDVPHPDTDAQVFAPALRLAGVNSLRAFDRGTKRVWIRCDGAVLHLRPSENRGTGYYGLGSDLEVPLGVSERELGEAVRQALEFAVADR